MTSLLPLFRCFFAAGSWEKDTKKVAAVTSLSFFLFCDNFSIITRDSDWAKQGFVGRKKSTEQDFYFFNWFRVPLNCFEHFKISVILFLIFRFPQLFLHTLSLYLGFWVLGVVFVVFDPNVCNLSKMEQLWQQK